jgi:gliding-associated putative ABC transporter substrate-binding component GldG
MSNWFKGFFRDKRAGAIQLLLIVGILIVINILIKGVILRLDLTADHRYTLSKVSKKIASNLHDPISVTAYFSANLPPQLKRVRAQFQNYLQEFGTHSHGNVEYKFVDPSKSKKAAKKAQQAGIRPLMISVRKKNKASQSQAFMGAVFHYHSKKQVVPVINPGAGLEYTVASAIKRLTVKKKPKVGLLQGTGEPKQKAMPQFMHALNQEYKVVPISGLDTTAVPADIDVLMVIDPKQKISTKALISIDQYIMAGGKALFAINRVQTQLSRGIARPANTGINKLLTAYHLPIKPDLVRDIRASNIRVQQRRGRFTIVNEVQDPYIPQITNFGKNPISKGLETVVFQFVSSLDTSQVDSSQHLMILASSSKKAGIARGYFNLNPMQKWSRSDFPKSYVPLAAAIKGRFTSAFAQSDSIKVPLKKSKKTAMVVFGNANFLLNGNGRQQHIQPKDNISLAVNSVDWLADNSGLIVLRTKGITNRPINDIKNSTKNALKYFNLFFPLLLVLGYGAYRYQRKKARRKKWMEEGV